MATKQLQLVLVTPEKTLLDEPVSGLRFPLFDGQIGILPNRAPMVGRLGYGELTITNLDGSKTAYFIDGGFSQINDNVVSILTDRALKAGEISVDEAREQLDQATARIATTDQEMLEKERDLKRSREMLALAKKS